MTDALGARFGRGLLVLVGSLSLVSACSRTSALKHPLDGAASDRRDGGKTADTSPDRGGDDLHGPVEPDVPADVSNRDVSPDAAVDRAVDITPDRGIDLAADRALEAPLALDLGVLEATRVLDAGTVDGARADGVVHDLPPSTGEAGVLTLVAGQLGAEGARDGIGTAARFAEPRGVTTDGMGNLFVADSSNNTIRKVVIATREVTTLAGAAGTSGSDDGIGGAARFSFPTDVAYDGAGNLLVADLGSRSIRKVVIATGAVTTVAGNAERSESEDGKGAAASFLSLMALACDGAGQLFVVDNNAIRKVVLATGEVTTLAGVADSADHVDDVGAAARFSYPQALTCDKAGNVFVAEYDRIRQVVAATGAVTTLPTNVAFGSLTGVTYDGAGRLLVADADTLDSKIYQVALTTGLVTRIVAEADVAATCSWRNSRRYMALGPPVATTLGVVADGAGNLYVADEYNGTVCEIVVATKTVTKLAGLAPVYGRTDGVGTEAQLEQPRRLGSDGTANLFVVDECTIRKISIAGAQVTTLAERTCHSRWGGGSATGVVGDGKGNIYFTESQAISKLAVDTGVVTILAGSPERGGHEDGTGAAASFQGLGSTLAYGGGTLFVMDDRQSIRKVDVATGTVTTLALSAPSSGRDGAVPVLGNPAGFAYAEAGSLLISDSDRCAVYKADLATGVVTVVAGSPGECGFADGTSTAARFLAPADMASDGAGSLYVADPANHAVRKVALATGTVTTVVGSPEPFDVVLLGPLPAHLNEPVGLTFVPGRGLFIADATENAVLLAQF